MEQTYNVLVAQIGWTKKELNFMKTEAAKGGLAIKDMKVAISVREVFKCVKEMEDGRHKYNVLIIQQHLDQKNESVEVSDLAKIKKSVPGIRILLCVSDNMTGSDYLQEVFKAGIYTAFYENDGTMQNIVKLIKNGRSATDAIKYYDIPEDKEELRKQIGYIENGRLNKIKNLIHKANTDEEIDTVLAHIDDMVEKKEFLYVISHLNNEDDIKKIFFKKGMGIFFDQKQYKEDLEEQENGGLLKRLRKKELYLSDYIIEPDELDTRLEMIKIRRSAALKKREQAMQKEQQNSLAEQVQNAMEDNTAESTDIELNQSQEQELLNETPSDAKVHDYGEQEEQTKSSVVVKKIEIDETPEKETEDIVDIASDMLEQEELDAQEPIASERKQENKEELSAVKETMKEPEEKEVVITKADHANVAQNTSDAAPMDKMEAIKTLFGEDFTPEMLMAMTEAINMVKNTQNVPTAATPAEETVSKAMTEEQPIKENDDANNKVVVQAEENLKLDTANTEPLVDTNNDVKDAVSHENDDVLFKDDEWLIDAEDKQSKVIVKEEQGPIILEDIQEDDKRQKKNTAQSHAEKDMTENKSEVVNPSLKEKNAENGQNTVPDNQKKSAPGKEIYTERADDKKEVMTEDVTTNTGSSAEKEIPSLKMTSLSIKSARKSGRTFHVVGGSKHPGVTFMASVLAHTYKHKFPERKVCVFSYDGNISQYTVLADVEEEVGMNKIEIKGVDYIVARHSDVMRIKSEYDAIFVESKGIKQVGKDYRKEKVFLITQGTDTHIPMLKQSCAYIEEVGFTNVTILASVFKFDKDKEREVKSMLGWNAPLINVGHLKSATRSLNALESLFD